MKIIFLLPNQNICCGYSKEPSQWDSSFEHPKDMLKLTDKKIIAILRWKYLLNWPYALTYLASRSNLLPNAFKWDFFFKVDFLNTVEAKVIILSWYVKPNETMAINKFQRSRLTFYFSAKVAHIGVTSTH